MHSPLSSFENHLPRRVITGRRASQVPRGGMPDQWLEPRLHRKRCWGGGRGFAAAGPPAVARAETFAEVPPEPPIEVVNLFTQRLRRYAGW